MRPWRRHWNLYLVCNLLSNMKDPRIDIFGARKRNYRTPSPPAGRFKSTRPFPLFHDESYCMSLHDAIKARNEELVISLIRDGTSISGKDRKGDAPLHLAASEGSVEITALLLQKGAGKDSRDRQNKTPLHRAAAKLHAPVVRVLMEAGANYNLVDDNDQSPFCVVSGDWFGKGSPLEVVKTMMDFGVVLKLHHAIRFGANEDTSTKLGVGQDLAESLVDNGASVNEADSQGYTPLHIAAAEGRVKIALLLLERGADKDSRSKLLQTPLHRAAYNLHTPIVRVLMDAGADPTIQDMYSNTPLVAALSEGTCTHKIAGVVRTMIELGVDLKLHSPGVPLSPFHGGRSPLHAAVSRGLDDCVRMLVAAGAHLDARDSQDQTPLHVVARKDALDITLLLLRGGADPNLRDKRQQTPLHRAATYAHAPVVRAFLEAGADVTLQAYGKTPLTVALAEGAPTDTTPEVVKCLIEFGADVNCADSDGWMTPLHAAVYRGANRRYGELEDCIDMLVAAGANLEARNPKGQTPLNFGAAQIDVVRSLVGHGADVNTQDTEGSSPLHRSKGDDATHYFNMDCCETVDLLLKAGADPTLLDVKGRTPAGRIRTDPWGCDVGQASEVKDQIRRACELLTGAPWRRRALLVMCIARHGRGEAKLRNDPAASGDDGWTRVMARVLGIAVDSDKQGIFRTIVGYL